MVCGLIIIVVGNWLACSGKKERNSTDYFYANKNQYIVQKAFGAKSLREAQRGMLFAGYLKLILSFV